MLNDILNRGRHTLTQRQSPPQNQEATVEQKAGKLIADAVGDKETLLRENQSTYIPLSVKHRLSNPGDKPLSLIEVQSGSFIGEDDIIRFEDIYGRNN